MARRSRFTMANMSPGEASGLGIEVEMDPSPVILIAEFNKLGIDIRSFKEPLKRAIKQVMVPSIKANFAEEGRPTPWPDLSEATQAYRNRHGYGSKGMLVRTGALKRSATSVSIWTIHGPDGYAAVESLPENVWYGIVHQQGASFSFNVTLSGSAAARSKGGVSTETANIPARPFLLIQDEDIDDIEKVFADWMDERINDWFDQGKVLAGA